MNACFLGSALAILGLLAASIITGETTREPAASHFIGPADPFIPAYLREHGGAVPCAPFASTKPDAWQAAPYGASPSLGPHARPANDFWVQADDARGAFATEPFGQTADFDW